MVAKHELPTTWTFRDHECGNINGVLDPIVFGLRRVRHHNGQNFLRKTLGAPPREWPVTRVRAPLGLAIGNHLGKMNVHNMDQGIVRVIWVGIDQSSLDVKPAPLNDGPKIEVEFVVAGPIRTGFNHLVDLSSVFDNESIKRLQTASGTTPACSTATIQPRSP